MESARALPGQRWTQTGLGWEGGGHQTEGASFKIVTFTEAKIKKEEFDMKGNDQAVSLVVWSSS